MLGEPKKTKKKSDASDQIEKENRKGSPSSSAAGGTNHQKRGGDMHVQNGNENRSASPSSAPAAQKRAGDMSDRQLPTRKSARIATSSPLAASSPNRKAAVANNALSACLAAAVAPPPPPPPSMQSKVTNVTGAPMPPPPPPLPKGAAGNECGLCVLLRILCIYIMSIKRSAFLCALILLVLSVWLLVPIKQTIT